MTDNVAAVKNGLEQNRDELVEQLPKTELHVHLEGTATPEFWLSLIKKYKLSEYPSSLKKLKQRFKFKSFPEFIALFRDIVFSLRSPEDFYLLAGDFFRRAARDKVRYCEMMFTPWFPVKRGIDFYEMTAEIDRAAKEAEAELGVEMKLIFDGPRHFGAEAVREVYDMALKDKTGRVVGVGLGGDENRFPARHFLNEFERAEAAGLKTIAHSGETGGINSMLETALLLKPSRIGHALKIPRSSTLERIIMEKNITLDLCPWSNVATGAVSSIEEHPFPLYLKRGYPITLNSDDPGIFQTGLNKEYKTMAELYNLSASQLADLSENAVDASFLSCHKKRLAKLEIEEYRARYRGQTTKFQE